MFDLNRIIVRDANDDFDPELTRRVRGIVGQSIAVYKADEPSMAIYQRNIAVAALIRATEGDAEGKTDV